jgi:hypothetical protein
MEIRYPTQAHNRTSTTVVTIWNLLHLRVSLSLNRPLLAARSVSVSNRSPLNSEDLSVVFSETFLWRLESLGRELQPLIDRRVAEIAGELGLSNRLRLSETIDQRQDHQSSEVAKLQRIALSTSSQRIQAMPLQGPLVVGESLTNCLSPHEEVFMRLVRKVGAKRATDLASKLHWKLQQPSPESRAKFDESDRNCNGRNVRLKPLSNGKVSSSKR